MATTYTFFNRWHCSIKFWQVWCPVIVISVWSQTFVVPAAYACTTVLQKDFSLWLPLPFTMIFTNSLIGLLQCSATAAGVKAQLAKCKHEDMPRAPCSNALCSLSSQHCTTYRARRLRPSNRRRPPKLSYVPTRWGPHRGTTAAATPARKSLHLDSSNDGHHSSYWAWKQK